MIDSEAFGFDDSDTGLMVFYVHREVGKICKDGDEVRQRVFYRRARDFVREYAMRKLEVLKDLTGVKLLGEYIQSWFIGAAVIDVMNRFLRQMVLFWVSDNPTLDLTDPVCDMEGCFYIYWRRELLEKLPALVDTVLNLVDDKRKGESVNVELLRHVIATIDRVGLIDVQPYFYEPLSWAAGYFRAVFEKPYFDRALESLQYEEWKKDDVVEFMEHAKKRIMDEVKLCESLLEITSVGRLVSVLKQELVENNRDYLEGAVQEMVEKKSFKGLRLHYNLMKGIDNGLSCVTKHIKECILNQGTRILEEHEQSCKHPEWICYSRTIDNLIVLHWQYASVIKLCFRAAQCIVNVLTETYRYLLAKDFHGKAMINVLAEYTDHFLRGEIVYAGKDESCAPDDLYGKELTAKIDGFFMLFLCLGPKMRFADLYGELLAKRLLYHRYNEQLERQVVELIQIKLGSKGRALTDMIEEAEKFDEMDSKFQKSRNPSRSLEEASEPMQFSVQVLRSSHCPGFEGLVPILPSSVQKCVTEYDQFYLKHWNNRRLKWCHELALSQMDFVVGGKIYDLRVTGTQAICLLHFNDNPRISLSTLANLVGLEQSIIEDCLGPLLRCGVLKVKTGTKAKGVYERNDSFESNTCILLLHMEVKKLKASQRSTQKHIEWNTEYEVDCAIVKIMKHEKSLAEEELVVKVQELVVARFSPHVSTIVRRIASCIERDFLVRDEDDSQKYHYAA